MWRRTKKRQTSEIMARTVLHLDLEQCTLPFSSSICRCLSPWKCSPSSSATTFLFAACMSNCIRERKETGRKGAHTTSLRPWTIFLESNVNLLHSNAPFLRHPIAFLCSSTARQRRVEYRKLTVRYYITPGWEMPKSKSTCCVKTL